MTRKSSSTHLSEQYFPLSRIEVDTVSGHFSETPWLGNIPDGWNERKTQNTRSRDRLRSGGASDQPISIMLTHVSTGLRVGGNLYGAKWFEVSVPRFVSGDNSILFKTEEEFAAAKSAIGRTIAQVCLFDSASMEIIVKRADLVQHVPVRLTDVIAAHRASRHPKFHKIAGLWVGQSLYFNGRFRKCRMYSPDLLKTGMEGAYTRIEWELRGPALSQDFGGLVRWNLLRLAECYRVHRQLCLGFDCSEIPSVKSIYHLLSLAERNGWHHDGIPAVELYLRSKKPSSTNRIRRKIAANRATIFGFKWSEMLPTTFAEHLQLGIKK